MYKVVLILDMFFLKYEEGAGGSNPLLSPGKTTLKKPSLIIMFFTKIFDNDIILCFGFLITGIPSFRWPTYNISFFKVCDQGSSENRLAKQSSSVCWSHFFNKVLIKHIEMKGGRDSSKFSQICIHTNTSLFSSPPEFFKIS